MRPFKRARAKPKVPAQTDLTGPLTARQIEAELNQIGYQLKTLVSRILKVQDMLIKRGTAHDRFTDDIPF